MTRIDQEIEVLWGKEEGLQRIRSLLSDRGQEDAVVFNFVLQRDLLDAAKVFPAVRGIRRRTGRSRRHLIRARPSMPPAPRSRALHGERFKSGSRAGHRLSSNRDWAAAVGWIRSG